MLTEKITIIWRLSCAFAMGTSRLTACISEGWFVRSFKSKWGLTRFKNILWSWCSKMRFTILLFLEKVVLLSFAGILYLFTAVVSLLNQSRDRKILSLCPFDVEHNAILNQLFGVHRKENTPFPIIITVLLVSTPFVNIPFLTIIFHPLLLMPFQDHAVGPTLLIKVPNVKNSASPVLKPFC